MKESIGASWLIGIVVTFIFLFSAFLAMAINYAKAFNVKNYIMNTIEQYEGYTEEAQANISAYLSRVGYNQGATSCAKSDFWGDQTPVITDGYCTAQIDEADVSYFKVQTFIVLEIPMINFKLKVPINGETSSIYHVARSY